MELREIKKIHRRNYDALDGVYWGCICGDSACFIANLMAELDKSQTWKYDLNRGYAKATSLYLENIKKVLGEISALEEEIIKLGSKL